MACVIIKVRNQMHDLRTVCINVDRVLLIEPLSGSSEACMIQIEGEDPFNFIVDDSVRNVAMLMWGNTDGYNPGLKGETERIQ